MCDKEKCRHLKKLQKSQLFSKDIVESIETKIRENCDDFRKKPAEEKEKEKPEK